MFFLVAAHVYFIISLILMTLSFAVTPDREHPETMIVHSFPYLNLKIAMCVIQLAVVWFGVNVAWSDFQLTKYVVVISWCHVILQFVVCLISSVVILNALGDMGQEKLEGKGLWWDVRGDSFILIGDIFANHLSFILNILFPLIQSQYLSCKRFKTHSLIITITDNKDAKME